MKEKDIQVDFKEQQMILYAEKDDNSYGPTQTGSYMSKNYLDDFQLKQRHIEENVSQKVLNSENSMIFYYMMIEDITVTELAIRVKLRRSLVEKHITVEGFKKAKMKTVLKYAEVFNIPVANLFQMISTHQDRFWKSHYIVNEEIENGLFIEQQKTKNPFVVKTTIEHIQS
ncbi:MAG: hypothetical protein WCH34_15065 [Bacteroidota bacterium]